MTSLKAPLPNRTIFSGMRCPSCKEPLERGVSRYAPFCSQRCKLIDLGKWLDGSYAIPGEPASEEDLAAEEIAGVRDRKRQEDR